jgi:hypothetical protein
MELDSPKISQDEANEEGGDNNGPYNDGSTGWWDSVKGVVNSGMLSTLDGARQWLPKDSDSIEQAINRTLGFVLHYVVNGVVRFLVSSFCSGGDNFD